MMPMAFPQMPAGTDKPDSAQLSQMLLEQQQLIYQQMAMHQQMIQQYQAMLAQQMALQMLSQNQNNASKPEAALLQNPLLMGLNNPLAASMSAFPLMPPLPGSGDSSGQTPMMPMMPMMYPPFPFPNQGQPGFSGQKEEK
jgi:hypothetical protein